MTHSHKFGYIGGILQAAAVYYVLHSENVTSNGILKNLKDLLKEIEDNKHSDSEDVEDSSLEEDEREEFL